jgi:hypothetical protein
VIGNVVVMSRGDWTGDLTYSISFSEEGFVFVSRGSAYLNN